LHSGSKVIAIEPDKQNFITLRKNIKLNNLENIYSLNVALSDENSRAKIFMRVSFLSTMTLAKKR